MVLSIFQHTNYYSTLAEKRYYSSCFLRAEAQVKTDGRHEDATASAQPGLCPSQSIFNSSLSEGIPGQRPGDSSQSFPFLGHCLACGP